MRIEEYVAMANRDTCPTCGAAHRPSDVYCASCDALVERPATVAVMLVASLVCAPLAWGSMLFMMALNDNPSDHRTGAQLDAAARTATKVAIVVALVGAVVLLIPLARRTLRIHTIWRAILIIDGAVAAATFWSFSG
jgi:hypothetical protein